MRTYIQFINILFLMNTVCSSAFGEKKQCSSSALDSILASKGYDRNKETNKKIISFDSKRYDGAMGIAREQLNVSSDLNDRKNKIINQLPTESHLILLSDKVTDLKSKIAKTEGELDSYLPRPQNNYKVNPRLGKATKALDRMKAELKQTEEELLEKIKPWVAVKYDCFADLVKVPNFFGDLHKQYESIQKNTKLNKHINRYLDIYRRERARDMETIRMKQGAGYTAKFEKSKLCDSLLGVDKDVRTNLKNTTNAIKKAETDKLASIPDYMQFLNYHRGVSWDVPNDHFDEIEYFKDAQGEVFWVMLKDKTPVKAVLIHKTSKDTMDIEHIFPSSINCKPVVSYTKATTHSSENSRSVTFDHHSLVSDDLCKVIRNYKYNYSAWVKDNHNNDFDVDCNYQGGYLDEKSNCVCRSSGKQIYPRNESCFAVRKISDKEKFYSEFKNNFTAENVLISPGHKATSIRLCDKYFPSSSGPSFFKSTGDGKK